jgi:hypothetical protein
LTGILGVLVAIKLFFISHILKFIDSIFSEMVNVTQRL